MSEMKLNSASALMFDGKDQVCFASDAEAIIFELQKEVKKLEKIIKEGNELASRIRQRAFDDMKEILEGIDRKETDGEDGWWETSTGATFGKSILNKIGKLREG